MNATRVATIYEAKDLQDEHGGWIIDHGDCTWHTTDKGTAVDLILPLVEEDRDLAEYIAGATSEVDPGMARYMVRCKAYMRGETTKP